LTCPRGLFNQTFRAYGWPPLRKMRVLLADDHPGILAAVQGLLKTDMEVVGCVNNGESLLEAGVRLRPDVIITDISMPKLSGIQAANRLREAGCASKVLFLTVHTDPEIVRTALETGALAYVLKTSMATDLLFAIHEAFQGRIFVSPEASAV
jgi:DNA-binding NarL/FixJ family response regulator